MPQGVAERLKEARLRAAVRLGETVSQDRMAELVSEKLGRTLHPTQWRRYEGGEREPPLEIIAAAARASGLPEAYIAFGVTPPQDSALEQHRKLTAEELERAKHAAAAARAKRGKRMG